MKMIFHTFGSIKAVEISADSRLINTIQDALDLITEASQRNARMIIIHKDRISKDFFDLRTGFAGEVLQKFVNYNMKLTVLGDFSRYSKNFQAFIKECNMGNQFFFLNESMELSGKLP